MISVTPAMLQKMTRLSGVDRQYHVLTFQAKTADKTVPSSFSIGRTVTISDAAMGMYAAKAAAAVSTTQSMPQGTYDFTHMSRQQLLDVTNEMILNHGVSSVSLKPLTDLIGSAQSIDFDTPIDVLALVSDKLKTARSSGDKAEAEGLQPLGDLIDHYRPRITHKDADMRFGATVPAAYVVEG